MAGLTGQRLWGGVPGVRLAREIKEWEVVETTSRRTKTGYMAHSLFQRMDLVTAIPYQDTFRAVTSQR